METKPTQSISWYCRPTAGHETHGQSAVIDESNGRTVAIVYDGAQDGPLLAAAPQLLAALQACVERMAELQKHTNYPLAWPRVMAAEAIARATRQA